MAVLRNALVRLGRAWAALSSDQRLAVTAAGALLGSVLLPWYEKNVAVRDRILSDSVSAFGVLSFVEAAIFLVALGVVVLLFFRGERRAFHLPGGDGTVILGAGLWAAFLLFWRVFDRPDVSGRGATVGIQWGFFIAFLAAGALAYAGYRVRAAHRAEPTAAEHPTTLVEPTPPPRRAPATTGRARPRRRPPAPTEAPTEIAGQLSFEEDPDAPRG